MVKENNFDQFYTNPLTAKKLTSIFAEKLKILASSERGWKPYIRVAFEQAKSLLLPDGGIDYFQHPRRKEVENKVL